MFGAPLTVLTQLCTKCHHLCHVMSCLSRQPSHCGSDGAVLTPPHHSPVCYHLSHQGHLTAPIFAHTTWTAPPPLISTLCCELVHLTLMTVFMRHPFLSPLSLTPACPSPSSPPALLLSTDPFTPHNPSARQRFPPLSTHPLGATHSFRLCGQVHSCSSHLFPPYSVRQ